MMKIITYQEIDKEQWGELVKTSSTGTWFQTPEAYEFFASMPELFRPFAVGLAYPQPLPEGKGEQPTPNPSLKGGELSVHNPSHMSRLEHGSNSLPFREGQGLGSTFAAVWGAHTADSTQYDLLEANAQKNRKNPTEAESVLWSLLKGNNIGLHFRRQHVILDYIVDFICLEKGLVIELDGGYHNDKEQKEYDEQRTAHLQKLGYTELRFTNEELLVNPEGVIARIKSVASSLPSFQGRAGVRPVLRGVCVGYVTVEKSAVKQFFTRRAIIMGGPALADDATDEEVELLMKAVKEEASLQLSPKGKRDIAQNPSAMGCFKGRLFSLLLGRDGVGLFPIYIETRNFNSYEKWKAAFAAAGFEYRPHLNFHVDCTNKEKMWERLSENRKRQIRKQPTQWEFYDRPQDAQSGKALHPKGKACIATNEAEVREWYNILEKLYRTKVKTPLWPVEFFLEAYRQGVGKFMLVRYEGKVIGGSMVVEWKPTSDFLYSDGHWQSSTLKGREVTHREEQPPSLQGRTEDRLGTVYEWFECGLNAEYKEQYPSVMATWAGMEYAAEHGMGRYDMMGAGEPDVPYGVRDFKSEFGGEMVEHGRFLCITKPMLYKIGTIGVKILKRLS